LISSVEDPHILEDGRVQVQHIGNQSFASYSKKSVKIWRKEGDKFKLDSVIEY